MYFCNCMTMIEALTQLKAFARQDGVILALVWTASFVSLMISPQALWGNLLALSTPFVVGWRLVKFRNYALNGVISFRRALAYSWYTFFFASLLFAIIQYIYFRFIDQKAINSLFMETVSQMIPIYNSNGISEKQVLATLDMMTTLKPIQLAFLFMMQNFIFGSLLSIPIAAIGMKRIK